MHFSLNVFFSLIIFKIYFCYAKSSLCWVLSLFAAIGLWILHRNLAGVCLETGVLMLLLVSPEDSMPFCFGGCAEPIFCCTWDFSSCSKQKWLSSYLCTGFSLLGLLLLQNTGFRAQAQYLCCMDLVAPTHMVSSQTRDQTRVLCIGS